MHQFLLSQKTPYFFFTGLIMFVAGFFSFGLGYSDAGYARNIILPVTFIFVLVAIIHTFYYFKNQFDNGNKLEAGCFGGITTVIILYNILYNTIILILFWK